MNVRSALILAISLALVGGACASAGTSGEEGIRPQDNEHTNAATLFLTQAQNAEDPEEREQGYRNALEAAMEGIQADSMNPQSYYQAGFALVMLEEDYAQADSLLDRATDLYSGDEFVEQISQVREQAWVNLYNQAIEPLNQGRTDEAIRLFQQANRMFDGRPEGFLNLGALYAQEGETEQAAEAFRDALEAVEVQSQRLEQADSVAPQQRESLQESERLASQNLGRMLTELGRSEEAIEVYEDYLERYPDDIQALSNLAVALTRAEMPDSAQSVYEGLLSRDDLTTQEYITVGVGLYQAEEWDRAAEAFQQAAERNPQSRDALYNLSQAYFAGERWEQAANTAEEVQELDPRNGNVYKLWARSLAETGDQQRGGDVLEEYEDLDFELDGLQFQVNQNGATVSGVLTNRTVRQGEPIILRFHFSDDQGNEIGTQDETIPAPGQDDSTRFEVTFNSSETVGGYWYEVVEPS